MKNKIIILVGISGSLKTTYTTEFIKENTNFIRINRDDIRRVFKIEKDYYKREDLAKLEKIVTTSEKTMALSALHFGYNLIIDNTNLKVQYINQWLKEIEFHNCDICFKLFDVKLNIAKNRVARRDFLEELEIEDESFTDYSHIPQVEYIEKQYDFYQEIKKWIIKNHKDKII